MSNNVFLCSSPLKYFSQNLLKTYISKKLGVKQIMKWQKEKKNYKNTKKWLSIYLSMYCDFFEHQNCVIYLYSMCFFHDQRQRKHFFKKFFNFLFNFFFSIFSPFFIYVFLVVSFHFQYSIVKDSNADLTVGNWESKIDP